MDKRKGEIITLLTIGAFLVITAASMISSVFISKNKAITKSSAANISDDNNGYSPQSTETPAVSEAPSDNSQPQAPQDQKPCTYCVGTQCVLNPNYPNCRNPGDCTEESGKCKENQPQPTPIFCDGHNAETYDWCDGNKLMKYDAYCVPYVIVECQGPNDENCPSTGLKCFNPGQNITPALSPSQTPEEKTPELPPVPTPQTQTIPETRTFVAGHDKTLEDIIAAANIPHVTSYWCYSDGTCYILGDGIQNADIESRIKGMIANCMYYTNCKIQAPTGVPKKK